MSSKHGLNKLETLRRDRFTTSCASRESISALEISSMSAGSILLKKRMVFRQPDGTYKYGHYPGEADSFMYHPKKEGKAIESSSEGQISFMDEEL